MDLTGLSDAELRATLERASSLVDAYCAVPSLPTRHDFRGGSIVKERHSWRLAADLVSGTRRVYPFHSPIRTVTGFVVKFTNSYQVSIAANDLYVNEIEGWAEVVSLAAVVSGLYPIGINFGLYTPVAEVDYTYGWSFAATDEILYPTDGFTYQASNGSWNLAVAPVVKRDGTTLTLTSDYTLDGPGGSVILATAPGPDAVITASYTWTLPHEIAEATGLTGVKLLGERAWSRRGLTGVMNVRIAEMGMDRRMGRGMIPPGMTIPGTFESIPDEAKQLLAPFVSRTIA